MHWKVLVERRFRRDLLEKGISGTGTVSPAQRSEEDLLKVKVIEDKARMMVTKMIIMVIMTIMIIIVNTT